MIRNDGRAANELRDIQIEKDYLIHPEGSVLITVGRTKVICNATIEDRVPPFLRGQGKGGLQQNIQCFLVRQNHVRSVKRQKGK